MVEGHTRSRKNLQNSQISSQNSTPTLTNTSPRALRNETSNLKSPANSNKLSQPNNIFKAATFKNLPNFTNDQLKKLEDQIQAEFRDISKNYLNSRLFRINNMIKEISSTISQFNDNDKEWDELIKYETQTILRVKDALEHSIQYGNSSLRSFESINKEINDLLLNVKTPLDLDEFLSCNKSLPFSKIFAKVIDPYTKEMNALYAENEYTTKLYSQLTDNNRVIIWQKFRAELINYKYFLVEKYMDELAFIEREEQDLNSSKNQIKAWDLYHSSFIPLTGKIHNTDTRDYISSKSGNRNGIELTNIKQANIKNQVQSKVSNGIISQTTNDDLDNDLRMIRNNVEEEVPQEPVIQDTGYQDNYEKLMKLNMGNAKQLPIIPALEQFPI